MTNDDSPPNHAQLSIDGDRWRMGAELFDMWGIRVASGTMNEAQCEHLIGQFDAYLAHGVNALTVFYMGCRGGNYDPFSPDGLSVDPGHQGRMERIIQAAAGRGMVVIVGIFYQAAPFGLRDADAVGNAVRTVTGALKPYPNIIINVCNEHNSAEYRKVDVFDFNDPERVAELCRIVHEVDPGRIVGGGGYDHDVNPVIGRSSDVDALLFDTGGTEFGSGRLCDHFVAEGVVDKPIVNVETFGGWTKQFARGIFNDDVKDLYRAEVDAAAARSHLSVFFHNNPWCQSQTEPLRYDLGGMGTEADPGIRWYFEHVRERLTVDG